MSLAFLLLFVGYSVACMSVSGLFFVLFCALRAVGPYRLPFFCYSVLTLYSYFSFAPPLCLPTVCLTVYLFVSLSVHLSACLSLSSSLFFRVTMHARVPTAFSYACEPVLVRLWRPSSRRDSDPVSAFPPLYSDRITETCCSACMAAVHPVSGRRRECP